MKVELDEKEGEKEGEMEGEMEGEKPCVREGNSGRAWEWWAELRLSPCSLLIGRRTNQRRCTFHPYSISMFHYFITEHLINTPGRLINYGPIMLHTFSGVRKARIKQRGARRRAAGAGFTMILRQVRSRSQSAPLERSPGCL